MKEPETHDLSLKLFTDGSVDTQSNTGYGAYLVVADLNASFEMLRKSVKVKRFESTNPAKLELQTLLWAMTDILSSRMDEDLYLTVYTDSQNIVGLPARREQLEKNNFYSSKNRRLNNHQLYKEFYRLTLILNCRFEKVAGHKASGDMDAIDRLFALVDKSSRHALRTDLTI